MYIELNILYFIHLLYMKFETLFILFLHCRYTVKNVKTLIILKLKHVGAVLSYTLGFH